MEKLDQYRGIIKKIMQEEVRILPATADVEPVMICIDVYTHCQCMSLGWTNTHRVHAVLIHLRLRHGKIWIERDGTQEGIVGILTESGVPKDDIVLAFHMLNDHRSCR